MNILYVRLDLLGFFFFFFFQAEDGIRDVAVTGVQTCALPISAELAREFSVKDAVGVLVSDVVPDSPAAKAGIQRGEDRKSTRLNSSHGYISYAVFCLKKKNKTEKAEVGLICFVLDFCVHHEMP